MVDRFRGWFHVRIEKGGSDRLFQDGGATYMSCNFRDFFSQYKVHHRVSSVCFLLGNTRSGFAVKSTKRLLQSNVTIQGVWRL